MMTYVYVYLDAELDWERKQCLLLFHPQMNIKHKNIRSESNSKSHYLNNKIEGVLSLVSEHVVPRGFIPLWQL